MASNPNSVIFLIMENGLLKFEKICEEATGKCEEYCTILAFILTPKNKLIFSTSTNYLFLADIEGTSKLLSIQFTQPITCISCNETGDFILISSQSKLIQLIEIPKLYETYKQVVGKNIVIRDSDIYYSYEHSCQVTSSILKPRFTRSDKVSFAFSDIEGNVFIYTQSTFPFSPRTQNISKESNTIINTMWWNNDHIAWSSDHNIVVYNISSSDRNIIFNSRQKNTQKTIFMFIKPNILCCTFDQYFLQVKLIDKYNPIIVNTGNTILAMATSGKSTLQIFSDRVTGENHFLVDQRSDICEEKMPKVSNPFNTFFLLQTSKDNVFICLIGNNIYTVNFASWTDRLDFFTVGNDKELYEKFTTIVQFFQDNERVHNILRTANHFLQNKSFDYSIRVCAENLKPIPEEWEICLQEFQVNGALHIIAPAVPVETMLDKTPMISDIVLSLLEFNNNTKRFFEVFSCLFMGPTSNEIFDKIENVADALIPRLKEKAESNNLFNIPLLYIYRHKNEAEACLNCALLCCYNEFFELITKYDQYKYCLTHIEQIFNVYGERFLDFLVSNMDQLTPSDVISKMLNVEKIYKHKIQTLPQNLVNEILFEEQSLKNLREYLYKYMKLLRQKGIHIPNEFITVMAILYIEYHSPDTMDVLSMVSGRDYELVKEAAHKHKMYREEALLLFGGGKMRDGMNIHLQYIQSPKEAVDYAMRCDDDKVWELLLKYSISDEKFRTYLLGNLTNLQNYITFYESITENLEQSAWSAIENRIIEFGRQIKIVNKIESIVSDSALEKYRKEVKTVRKGKRIFDIETQ